MSYKKTFYVLIPLFLSACASKNINSYSSEKTELDLKCQEMKEQIRELKGKPIRRTGVSSRYDLECKNNHTLI